MGKTEYRVDDALEKLEKISNTGEKRVPDSLNDAQCQRSGSDGER